MACTVTGSAPTSSLPRRNTTSSESDMRTGEK